MVGNDEIRAILKSQYHASMAMLRDTIERCSDGLWSAKDSLNAFWQVAYHAVFFAHLYLHRDKDAFRPWAEHQSNVQNEDGLPGPPDPDSSLPLIPRPYTRSQVLAYWKICDDMVDAAINGVDLDDPNCGFPWYKNVTKLEHLFISIRHIQHHTGQLADRRRNALKEGTRWIGMRRPG
jgi:DinB family protein